MENDINDIKIKNFITYLNKIGLLTEEDNQMFINNFYDFSNNNNNANTNSNEIKELNEEFNHKNLQENLIKALNSFLNSLNEEKNKIISLNIYKNYIFEQKSSLNKKALLLYKLYAKLKIINFFKKWFVLTNKNSNINYKTLLLRDSIEENNNSTIPNNISNFQNQQGKTISSIKYNNSYVSTYNYSPKNNNPFPSNKMLINLKQSNNNKVINLTRNHIYNLNTLNNAEKLIDSKSNKNKLINNSKNYTFTNDYSTYNNYNDNIIEEKNSKKDFYKNKILSGKGNQLFNKLNINNKKNKNKINSKLKAHFEYLGKLSKSKKDHKLIPEKTTEYIKEQEEIKNNCTFKPKINYYKTPKSSIKKIKYNNSEAAEKLYLDNQRRIAKRTTETLLRDNKLSKENTFQPNFISSSVKKLKKNFSLRLYNFTKLKEENMNKIINSIETDYNSIYTFSPKLNISYNNKINYKKKENENKKINKKKIPAYQRLYNENKEKMIRQEERKNQIMEDILLKANNPITYSKTNININENYNISNTTKSVDYKKLDELYNDYKKKQIKIKQKQEFIDNEKGITFTPILINGEKYLDNVSPNFYEREKKFVEDQKNHIEAYRNYLIKEKERYLKRYSEDKKIIVKNVIERLYKDGLEKVLIRNNTKPNIFTKNCYKTENKEDYDGNETVYVNQSLLKVESLKDFDKNTNKSVEIKNINSNSNESNMIKSNVKTSMMTNDNFSSTKDNNNNNFLEQLPLMMNSK